MLNLSKNGGRDVGNFLAYLDLARLRTENTPALKVESFLEIYSNKFIGRT